MASSGHERALSLKETIASDLLVNAGTSGTWNGVWAFLVNPGFAVISVHRIAVWLKSRGQNRLADLIWHWNIRHSGCHIHLHAVIGPGLKLPHPVGVVIGLGARVGAGVTLYQGVTLGRGPSEDVYPVIENGVTIFPNTVIAGSVTVGENATVGALSFVKDDVPPNAVAVGSPAAIIRIGTQSTEKPRPD